MIRLPSTVRFPYTSIQCSPSLLRFIYIDVFLRISTPVLFTIMLPFIISAEFSTIVMSFIIQSPLLGGGVPAMLLSSAFTFHVKLGLVSSVSISASGLRGVLLVTVFSSMCSSTCPFSQLHIWFCAISGGCVLIFCSVLCTLSALFFVFLGGPPIWVTIVIVMRRMRIRRVRIFISPHHTVVLRHSFACLQFFSLWHSQQNIFGL